MSSNEWDWSRFGRRTAQVCISLWALLTCLSVEQVHAFYHSLPIHHFYHVPSDLIKNVDPTAFLLLVNHSSHVNMFLIPDTATAESMSKSPIATSSTPNLRILM